MFIAPPVGKISSCVCVKKPASPGSGRTTDQSSFCWAQLSAGWQTLPFVFRRARRCSHCDRPAYCRDVHSLQLAAVSVPAWCWSALRQDLCKPCCCLRLVMSQANPASCPMVRSSSHHGMAWWAPCTQMRTSPRRWIWTETRAFAQQAKC